MRAVAGYSITPNATESALASADGYASEPVSLGAGGIAFEAESRDDFFWKVRNPSARKNFYCYQTFLIKRGWVLRWEGHARLNSNYNALKGRFKKMQVYAGGVLN